jgi:hypothetical protein
MVSITPLTAISSFTFFWSMPQDTESTPVFVHRTQRVKTSRDAHRKYR